MAPRCAHLLLLLCGALFTLASVGVHSQVDVDYAAPDYAATKSEREAYITEFARASRHNGQKNGVTATTAEVSNFASTKKKHKKSPPPSGGSGSPPSGGGGGGGGKGGSITVSSGGSYSSVQDAIDAASSGDTITINGGDYNEKVVVPSSKSNLKIVGLNNPRIYYSQDAAGAGTLSKSATFSVSADGFQATGVTFENTKGFPNGKNGGQAVALYVDGSGAVFTSCTLKSTQDTLYAFAGSQTYKNCLIIGSVDYICGDARATFQSCIMQTISNGNNRYTAVAAQRNMCGENTGFAFIGGSVKGNGNTWLGRTWGKCATIIYSGTSISGSNPKGWTTMSSSKYSSTARFGGVNIGIDTSSWVSWALSTSEASSVLSQIS